MATSTEKLKQYEDLFAKRQQAQDVPAFSQQFEDDYLKATDYNKDLIQQKSSALGQLQAVAPEMRERYMTGPIMSPTQQRSLIAQARQNPISDWGSAIDLLGQRGMKLQDILGNAVSGYQSQLSAQDRDLENAWRLYQDALQQEQFNKQNQPGPSLEEIINGILGGTTETDGEGIRYEIPEDNTKYGTASLGNSFDDRLTQQVLNMRRSNGGFGDTYGSYVNTALEPLRNIKSVGDVASIPARGIATSTAILGDLFNRIFK